MTEKLTQPPPDDRTARRRLAILKAATVAFAEKGYAAATTLDIARAAGVSKRDLYAVFPSKQALTEAWVRHGVSEMTAPVALAVPRDRAEVYAALRAFAVSFLEVLLRPTVLDLYRVAIAEAPSAPELGRLLRDAGAGATRTRVDAYIRSAVDAGLVRYVSLEAASGVFFFILLGDLRLVALLDPENPVDRATIARRVDLALLALQRMELA
jgi:AcrR family transcriptional regulator